MKPRSPYPAFLFDLDGTLLDTVYAHVAAWAAAFASQKIEIPDWKIHRRIGMSGKSLIHQLFREHEMNIDRVDLDLLEKRRDEEFRKAAGHLRPVSGANQLLHFLSVRKIAWAIATTGNRAQTNLLLKHLELPAKTVVVTGDDVAQAKPAPDIFVLAAKRLKVPIEDCIVIGDSVWDVLAAGRKRALPVGLLSGGYSREELERAGAFRVYADPADLLLHIEDLGIPENG